MIKSKRKKKTKSTSKRVTRSKRSTLQSGDDSLPSLTSPPRSKRKSNITTTPQTKASSTEANLTPQSKQAENENESNREGDSYRQTLTNQNNVEIEGDCNDIPNAIVTTNQIPNVS